MTKYLEPHQTRQWPPPPYERKLAAAIEEIFAGGTHDLAGLVAGLNAASITAPDGQVWTEERFVEQMRSLGG
jgi:hypothetical protein